MMGKKSLYLAMLRRYLTRQRQALADLRQALAAGDLVTAERVAHTTKAVSGNIGAVMVQDSAAVLEAVLHQRPEPAQIEAAVAVLERPLGELLAHLERELGPDTVLPPARAALPSPARQSA